MIEAIFLDRDGVINRERGDYTWREEDFEFNEALFPVLKPFFEKGTRLIVITNQGGISKGIYEHADVRKVHQKMKTRFEREGMPLTDVFYCPHHSNLENCLCRKPKSLMVERALALYGLRPENCVMIGDSERDVVAANGAGVRGIQIQSNQIPEDLITQITGA